MTQHIGSISNDTLYAGDMITSPSGQFTLIYQDDGNLVLYSAAPGNPLGRAVWNSGTSGRGPGRCAMQADGNLVIYATKNTDQNPLWSSGTQGHANTHLYVQDDGNVVIYVGTPEHNGRGIWSTNTHAR